MEFSMENICRTCMSDENEMISIYNFSQDFAKHYSEMLMICASIQINEEDELPELICQQCIKQLTIAFNFKKQSEQVDATLREITKNPAIEFIKEEVPEQFEEILKTELHETGNIDEFKFEPIETESTDLIEKYEDEEYIEDVIFENIQILEEEIPQKESFTCALCSKSFTKLGHFIKHKDNCTSDFQCIECNTVFKTKIEYTRHKKTHTKPFTCDLCGKQFRSAHGLGYHIKIHSGIKNYVCAYDNCKKRFALKQGLDKHLCVHSKDGNHLCYLCGKMYGTYDALHYHIKTHEGLRPHLCVHCGKTFKQSCHLKSHMWIHNGIKPHECKTCGKCYTSGHQLKKHLKKYCNNFRNVL